MSGLYCRFNNMKARVDTVTRVNLPGKLGATRGEKRGTDPMLFT